MRSIFSSELTDIGEGYGALKRNMAQVYIDSVLSSPTTFYLMGIPADLSGDLTWSWTPLTSSDD